jgi:hypothetical protein
MKTRAALAVVTLAAVALVGCSDDDTGSASDETTTTVNAECAARADLQTSVKALASPTLLTGGREGIESAVDQVTTDLDAVASASKDANKSDVDATKAALEDLKSAVSDAGDGNLTANLQAIGTAIAKVGTTGETLVSSLGADC